MPFLFVTFLVATQTLWAQFALNDNPFFWSARQSQADKNTWNTSSIESAFGPNYEQTLSSLVDLKAKDQLSCNNSSVVLTIPMPSLNGQSVTIRFWSPLNQYKNNVEVFRDESGRLKEVARTTYEYFRPTETQGKLKLYKILAFPDNRSAEGSVLNENFFTLLYNSISPTAQSSIQINSSFAREWVSILKTGDLAYACCFHSACKSYLDSPAAEPRAAEVKIKN